MLKPEKIYAWMDIQIRVNEWLNQPVDVDDPFYIRCAGAINEAKIHIYGIDNLCKELAIECNVESYNDEFDSHYFMYKGYKFFGLVKKENEDERK